MVCHPPPPPPPLLDELNKWCTANSLTPHSSKCEVMLLHRGSFIGPHPLITIGNVNVAWVCHVRLLGITIDRKLTWKKHLKELKNNFVCKLNLLKKCSFLKKKSLLDLYFKVILPSVTYGITIWGNCNNLDYIKSLQALHCRAGRLIFNLPRDTPSDVVMELTQWDSIYDLYKLSLVKLFYNIVNDNIPSTISDLAVWRNSPYDLRGYKKAIVPRFSTYFIEALCYGILSQIILKTLIVLRNFIARCNLIPNLGNSDLFVHENYKSTFFTFKSDYPFDVFYVG